MAKPPSSPNKKDKYVKAFITNSDGEEEIVGMAAWSFYTGLKENLFKKEEKKEEKELTEEERFKINEGIWGPGANFKFCQDAFCVADEHMLRSTGGRHYASKSSSSLPAPMHPLNIPPSYQLGEYTLPNYDQI